MPWVGFELQTLGAVSSDEDHYTMPLPQIFWLLLLGLLSLETRLKPVMYSKHNQTSIDSFARVLICSVARKVERSVTNFCLSTP